MLGNRLDECKLRIRKVRAVESGKHFSALDLLPFYSSQIRNPALHRRTDPGQARPIGLDSSGPGTETRPVPFQVAPRVADCDASIPQTPHLGGMQVAMADGSVRGVSGSISQWTFWAAATPAGGEVVSVDW